MRRVLYKEEIAEFRADFDKNDTDHDGFLVGSEIRPMLKDQLEREPTDEEVNAMMTEFDIDKDGKITWDEYMTTICGVSWCEDEPPRDQPDAVPLKYMVAVDGSRIAVQAFKTAARLMKKGDSMIVYHVTNPGRYKDMSANFHPDTIKANFETEAIRCDIAMTHDITFVCEEKKEGEKIREKIRDYAAMNADVVVIGSYGAKRQAKDAKADFTCIGTTTAMVTSGCKAISLVVKPSSGELAIKAQRRFHIAVDGSDIAHNAYKAALEFMKKGDFMSVLYIETKSSKPGKPIVEAYEDDMQLNKVKGAARAFPAEEGKSIADQIVDIAEADAPGEDFGCCDVLVLGSTGLSTMLPPRSADAYKEYVDNQRKCKKNGSVAGTILTKTQCTLLLITVDALLAGAVKSHPFQDWFDGKSGVGS